jgi:phosphatidylglycerol---prolipoprotein diacylglyceryl transferase
MYPKISDIINDIFNTDICLPLWTYATFLVLAFIISNFVLKSLLKEQQEKGYFHLKKIEISVSKKTLWEIIFYTSVAALCGYKLGLFFINYDLYCENPISAFPNFDGSLFYASVFGSLSIIYNVYVYLYDRRKPTQIIEINFGILNELPLVLLLAFIFGLLGAVIFYNVERFNEFILNPIQAFKKTGMNFLGGFIFGSIAIATYLKYRKYAVLPFCDSAAIALMLGHTIARSSCHLSGDGCWGIVNIYPKPTFLPNILWSCNYAHNVIKMGVDIPDCIGFYCKQLPQAVFPTALYESIFSFIAFVLLYLIRNKTSKKGQIFAFYLFLSGLSRFLIEYIRVNPKYNFVGLYFSQAQIIAIFLMLIGFLLFMLIEGKNRGVNEK